MTGPEGPQGPSGSGGGGQGDKGQKGQKGLKGAKGAPGVGCIAYETLVTMADGATKNVELIEVEESVKSFDATNFPSSGVPSVYMAQTSSSIAGSMSTATVKTLKHDTIKNYFLINDSLKVTAEHPLMTKRGSTWQWRRSYSIEVGDFLFSDSSTEIEVTSISEVNDAWIDIVKLDVEDLDCFFAGGVLNHNKN